MSLSRISLLATLIILSTVYTVWAVSFPATGPSGSFSGWSFGTYFKNMVSNPCPVWYYVSGFSDGTGAYSVWAIQVIVPYAWPLCAEIVSSGGVFGNTLYYNGSTWVSNNALYNDGTNVGIGLGGLAPQAKLDIGWWVKIANDLSACVASKAGTIRYTGSLVEYCNGTTWMSMGGASNSWILTGNLGTNPGNSATKSLSWRTFLWTLDMKDLVIGTNEKERMRITASGSVGIGTEQPQAILDIASIWNAKDHIVLSGNGSGWATIRRALDTGTIELWGGSDWNKGWGIYINGNNSSPSVDAGSVQVTLGNTGAKFEVFGSDNTQKLYLSDSGDLGIGTITPGAPDKSLIYQEIAKGSMPPKGPPVNQADLSLLKDWISQGALNN